MLRAANITSCITYLFVKVSILLLYSRLFGVNRILRFFIRAGIALQIVGYTGLIGEAIVEIYLCSWNPRPHSFCNHDYKVQYAQAVFSVLTDFYILILPIKVILGLQMSWRRKSGVMSVFMTGLL